MKITQAVILAGGAGTRLKPFTLTNPKPMMPINGRPFLEHLINLLKENGIKEAIILAGYLGERIEEYFGDGSKLGLKIKYSYTPFLNEKGRENQSGLRLKNAEKLLSSYFLLLYCDNYWPLNLKKMTGYFLQKKCDVLVTAYSNKDGSTKNNLLVDKNGFVKKYDSTRSEKNLNCVDIGFFLVNKKVLKLLPKLNSKFENVVLPKLMKRKKLSAYLSDQKYYSISDIERVRITEKFLTLKKVVFLDRDGVINKRPPKADYVKKWREFEFLPGAKRAIKLLKDKRYKIFIISNQPGIARGALTKQTLQIIHKRMVSEIKKAGGNIEKIYICPHGWDEECECRKPKPGMLLTASREYFIDLSKALFIGDDTRDREAGNSVNCKTILVKKNLNLLQIVNFLLNKYSLEY